ncbi:MAG: autotransporter-associated beta strand repeat-containing protein [Chthoniobacteraceae bacterium]
MILMGGLGGWPPSLEAAEETWIARTSAPWSLDSAWLDGSAPAFGGANDLTLRFGNDGSNSFVATNDLGTAFRLNRLVLANKSNGTLTIDGLSGSQLEMAGDSPVIEVTGPGASVITSEVWLNASNGQTTISGTGLGGLFFARRIREKSPGQRLVINAPAPSLGTHVVTLSFDPSNTSGLVLEAGNLQLNVGSTGLGTGPVTINGGTLRAENNTTTSLSNPIELNADLDILIGGFFTIHGAISSNVGGTGLIYRNSGQSFRTLTLTGASTYEGPTILDASPIASAVTNATSELKLSGAGSILNSSAIHVRAGSTLRIEATGGANDRVGDSTPVHLRSGEITLGAPASATGPQTETLAGVTVAGASTISVLPDSDAGVVLSMASLSRTERGTVLFRGNGLGRAAGADVGNVLINQAPALTGGGGSGPETNILPWALGSTSNSIYATGTGLVTYDAGTGIRLLDESTEYNTDLSTATATQNVRLTASAHNDAALAINSLVTNLYSGALTGTGSVAITSGALLNLRPFTIDNDLSFGSTEGIVSAVNGLTVTGIVSGSAGLTQTGGSILTLSGNNTFTGPLTINSGALSFSSLDNLGPDTSAIILNGPEATLRYRGASDLTLSRPIEVRTGVSGIQGYDGGQLVITAPISGVGGLTIAGRVRFDAANTYLGPTVLRGIATFAADSAFGAGGELDLDFATLELAGNWISTRTISLTGRSTLDTAGFEAELGGVLSDGGLFSSVVGLTKTGAGVGGPHRRVVLFRPFDGEWWHLCASWRRLASIQIFVRPNRR